MWNKQALLLSICVALNIINVSYLVFAWFESTVGTKIKESYSYLGHDYPESLPMDVQKSIIVPYEESEIYRFTGIESDSEWLSLAGPEQGFGYLRLGPDNRIFAVSMFHQMHCLRIINLAMSKEPIATPSHLHHCFNYLRQAALCGADLSLEPGDFEERDFSDQKVSGWHKCKDWSQAYSIMENNYAQWKEAENGHLK